MKKKRTSEKRGGKKVLFPSRREEGKPSWPLPVPSKDHSATRPWKVYKTQKRGERFVWREKVRTRLRVSLFPAEGKRRGGRPTLCCCYRRKSALLLLKERHGPAGDLGKQEKKISITGGGELMVPSPERLKRRSLPGKWGKKKSWWPFPPGKKGPSSLGGRELWPHMRVGRGVPANHVGV